MEKIFEGKTEQEAVELAAKEFGVSREYMDIEVVQKGKKRLFGTSGKVVIKVSVDGLPQSDEEEYHQDEKKQRSQRSQRAPSPEIQDVPLSETTKEQVKKIVKELITKMGIEVQDISFSEDAPLADIDIENLEDQNILIGKFGKNIEALQIITNAILRSNIESDERVTLDIENYRKKRTDRLRDTAIQKAQQVLNSGKPFLMDSYSPFDRRQIHTAIREVEGVDTESEGDGYLKRVRIFLS